MCTDRVVSPTYYSLLTTHYSLLTTHYSLLTTYYLLLTTYYLLLTTYYLLLTTYDAREQTEHEVVHGSLPPSEEGELEGKEASYQVEALLDVLLTSYYVLLITYYLLLTTHASGRGITRCVLLST